MEWSERTFDTLLLLQTPLGVRLVESTRTKNIVVKKEIGEMPVGRESEDVAL